MRRLLLFLSLPLYVIDQCTKAWIVRHFELNGDGRVVVPDFFTLHHVANTGIAFGQFNGGRHSNYIFGGVAIAALLLITWLYRQGTFSGGFSRVAIALLVAGVCGNFTDRLLHGYVVDFLQFDLHIP
ncbi:MAG TPA: signal peptidase II, partial [Verrucomicrobiaceae bacterium]